jgi:hypothetical protein
MLPWLIACTLWASGTPELPHTVWLEAETFGPLKGANFSYLPESRETKGSWSLAGPDTAPAWTQGGESEFMSIAARADASGEITVAKETEIPAAGSYTLWVRYADYRNREEAFGVRVKQGGKTFAHIFGRAPVVDELDPMKLYWDWAYAWDSAPVALNRGPARVEIFTTGPTGARRCIDCLCLTTDRSYRPNGREKPDCAAWQLLRALQRAGMPPVAPLTARPEPWRATVPKAWKIADGPPVFLWNVGSPWQDEFRKPAAERVDFPFAVDAPHLKEFLAAYRGKAPPVYGHPLSGPVWHISLYPAMFAPGSPFLDWLARHPDRRFAILLNYGDPSWPAGADRAAVHANLRRLGDRFVGYVAGEGIAYDYPDEAALAAKIGAAKSRAGVLAALRAAHTEAVVKKFTDYAGAPVTPQEAWGPVISCLSAAQESYAHALCDWGCRRVGHENTGNSPTLARRLAFLRGAGRQFGAKLVDYQSCNLGDSSTMFTREAGFYPASSRYILDNSYDAFAGAGVTWLLKDYLLWHLAGAEAFYHEEGNDLLWKPAGGAAGDSFPLQLSPKGKVAEAVQRLAQAHPRGTQLTPVAFLLDEAHGYTQERFQPGAFGLDPQGNPAVLTPGRHEAAIRGWFDVAYYPAPETQNAPATAIRQTYVNGIFGDLFDVIVTAPKRTEIAFTYPVLIAAGEVPVSEEWGAALRDYVQRGGTLVVCADGLTGPGAKALRLPTPGPEREASAFRWSPTGETVPSNVFRYRPLPIAAGRVLATAPDGSPLVLAIKQGKGQVVLIGVPLGLGIDMRPVPLLGLLMRHLTEGLVPVKVTGDVEWIVNRLDDGGWLVALLNNRGITKPAHGILPTDHSQAQTVRLRVPFGVRRSAEWMTEQAVRWTDAGKGATTTLTVPAGAARLVAFYPR